MIDLGLSMRACWHIAIVLLLEMLAGGCAKDRQCCPPPYPQAPIAIDCQPVERQPLVADLSLLHNRPQPFPARSYCKLTERDAQCLAAMYAPNARLLDQEAEAVLAQRAGHHQADGNETTAEALKLQAIHERNRNASAALQLLLRIADSEQAADNLRRQLVEVRETLADLQRLQNAGLELPLSLPQTEAQGYEVEHKLTDLELTIDLLNEQLATLLGTELPRASRFWPDVNLQVNPAIPLLEEAQSLALLQRADLAALRAATRTSGPGGALALRAIGGQTNAGLGLSAGGCGLLSLLHFRAAGDEASVRRDQLQGAAADKENSIRHEVAQSLATIEARLNQIAVSQQRANALRQHLENLDRSAPGVNGASFEIRKARVALLTAHQDLFHDVIEWKIAAVKLREAEGELAIDCGYTLALDYAACYCP